MTALTQLAEVRMEERRLLALSDGRTRVLLAVIRQQRPTVRSVAKEAGRSVCIAHRHLAALRRDGFVTWEPGHQGTLRSLLREV